MTEIAFVLARRQNEFFAELVEAIRDELTALGVRSSVSLDGFPAARPGLVYALVPPHEWVALHGGVLPPPELLRRTVVLCAEQPGTTYFDGNAPVVGWAGGVFDLSPVAVAEWRRRGVRAERFTLGHTARWAAPRLDGPRDVEIAFLGSASERRNRLLATYAPILARRHCRIVVSENSRPNHSSTPGFLTGDAKRELLRRTQVLLNIHAGEQPYFEHLRVAEAILSGAVVVSEHGTGTEPLVPGAHYLSGRPETLGHLASELLENEPRRRAIQDGAFALLEQHPLSETVERFAAVAADVDRTQPVPRRAAYRPSPAPEPPPPGPARTTTDRTGRLPEWISWTEIAPPERMALLHGQSLGDPNAFESVLTFAPDGAATRIEMRTVFPTKELRDEAVEKYHAIEGGRQTLSNLAAYVSELVRKGAEG